MTQTTAVEQATKSKVRDLEGLFAPKSIAVVGASRTSGTVGNDIMRNLVHGEFTGVVYPINPKAKSILGIRCIPNISAMDEAPDMAVIIVPATAVEEVLVSAADKGTKNFVVISAGFKEIGGEGLERELRLKAIAKERGLNIVGPNCLGIINTDPNVRMNAAFGREMPKAGLMGLISQSGALSASLLDYAAGRGIGFSRFASFGNKADVTEVDLLRSIAADPNTKVIMMYIEDLTDGRAFVETAYEITHGENPKPILAIKTGRTPQGAAAAASHTGSMAGSDEVYDAIMTQAGVIRVESVEDLFDLAEIFSDPVMPAGRRTAIITNAGGPGIMATDACIRYGLQLSKFADYTIKSLKFQMPPTSSLKNPVDVIGDARHDRYRAALDAIAADENVDNIMVLVTPQSMTPDAEIGQVVGEAKGFCTKPIVACMMGAADVAEGVEKLHSYKVPTYPFPENAMRALAAKARFAEWTRTPHSRFVQYDADKAAVEKLLEEEFKAGRKQIVELKALEVFRHYGFSLVPYALAKTADEAVAAAAKIGYPVVMKISGPKILHKTDVGGVKLNLRDEASVRAAFDGMIASVKDKMGDDVEIWGVLIQKMLPPGKETILGMSRDERFGPLIMFGLGGIYTEALKDVSFRLAPIRENSAYVMVRSIRSYKLLEGVRGEPPSDVPAIADALCRLSQLVTEHPRIKELDINPLIVYPQGKGVVVADARIILSEK
ncbi:MAG TPA: acetate--CoA ligase family protein [Phycisphaerae bacterium]|jgi:acetyl coenzyme A synthetase (ADP forming)-like protein|nr:acetate--CoA ligase family protein [Phycisphaerae bacterium]HOJ56475.1 acetate--CoA ligase family protein [Phycisphaerae bacterium]HOL27740.1 acetate--CoA ligase family protein [Phycisphaerae bacterium]HPP22674.1 acetate--CoA ligase family protein [Phycisphaerae bacterium]HPU34235.1 acetate--CoA ligase family protein [Phycisphaerae bacterium]